MSATSIPITAQAKRDARFRIDRKALTGYAFILPALILLVVFALGPFLFTIWVSLHEWNMLTPVEDMPWVGLDNYKFLFQNDPLFRETLKNTIVFTLGNVGVSLSLALLVAIVLNGPIRWRPLWRAAFFLPYITAPVAIAIVWRNMLDGQFGMINGLLARVGLPQQGFIDSLDQAMPSLIGVAVWQGVGYYMIIFLAGLQAIPYDLYEAGKLDGAGNWRLFFSITIPLLRPTILFVVVINTLNGLQIFDLPFVLTNGGPVNRTNTMVMYMYDTAFNFLRMGRATALAVVLFGIIFLITMIQLRLLRDDS
ncbi:MAG TPA: sugar ABC transporter permease [Thermomicrobiales bacterium]|nr:sugar ABC transporter permease [Thermomicrobiales bacterium]